jgi:hypothetical protein
VLAMSLDWMKGSRIELSLTGTLAAALAHVPPALIDAPARGAIETITNRIPAALTRRTYLECRLAEGVPRTDLVLCVDRSSRVLLMDPKRAWVPTPLQTHPLWAGLERTCSHWADERSTIGQRIYDLWLEFDVEQPLPDDAALVPNVFLGLTRTPPPTGELWAGAVECSEAVLGRRLDPQVAALGHDLIAKLPQGATLLYVGLMYPRNDKAVRLCVAPLAGAALLDYLRAIGWPGVVDEIEAFLRSLPCGPDTTALESTTLLHVDVSNGVAPLIGLEIPLAQYPQVVDGIVERALLDALCERALCSFRKRDALLRWPGYSIEEFPHQCWPSLALRRVSHLKVAYAPGRTPEIKTYLSFFHDVARRRPQPKKASPRDT